MNVTSLKSFLFFSLIVAMILPFNTMDFAEAQSPSLYKQIRDNMAVEYLQCSNDKLLVERNNSKLACVSQDTQIKNEWIALNTEPFIGGNDNANGEPVPGVVRAKLSKLPVLNEVVTLTVEADNIFASKGSSEPSEGFVKFYLKNSWEFVDVSREVNHEPQKDGTELLTIAEPLTVKGSETQTFSVNVKLTEPGINRLSVGIPFVERVQFNLYVDEHETLTLNQYFEKYPEKAPWNNEPDSPLEERIPVPLDPESESQADVDTMTSTTDEEFERWLEEDSGYSDEKITLSASKLTQGEFSSNVRGYQPWVTMTYPEQVQLGVPFDIELTYTYTKTFYDDETEWYEHDVYDFGEDWWIERTPQHKDRFGNLVQTEIYLIFDKTVSLLSPDYEIATWEYVLNPTSTNERTEYMLITGHDLLYPFHKDEESSQSVFKYIPFENTQAHSETLTFQIDQPIEIGNHKISITIDRSGFDKLYFYYDEGIGYLSTESQKLFESEHIEYFESIGVPSSLINDNIQELSDYNLRTSNNFAIEAPSSILPLVSQYENPYDEWCGGYDSFESKTPDQKLWIIKHEKTDCGVDPSTLKPVTEEQYDSLMESFKEHLDELGITSDYKNHLKEKMGMDDDLIEKFFNAFPDLEFQSIDISNFFLIPSAYAATAQDSEEPNCGSNTFLNDIGVCQVIDGGCEPDINGDTFWCGPQESIFMDGGRGVTIIILVITIPIVFLIIGLILWKKKQNSNHDKE